MGYEVEDIEVIELSMMDKRKYFPLTLCSGLCIRSMLYPFTLIKTRLQIQRGNTVYKGTFDALFKIGATEGMSGLYRGFFVSCFQIVPSMSYIATYEHTRTFLHDRMEITDNGTKSLIAGGCGSIAGQTMAVPLDIVVQHLQLMGSKDKSKPGTDTSTTSLKKERAKQKLSTLQHIHISEADKKSRLGAVNGVVRSIYTRQGARGFYKGYFVSLACFAPNSALWWFFYDQYTGLLASVAPVYVPRLLIQVVAGPLGGISSAIITNPLDLIRARIQVEGTNFGETCELLWKQEGVWLVTKGLSARLVQTVAFSFFIILGYETIKRWSILDEYKHKVKW